ncbi:MAG: (2Fe-2S)-binding protein [Promethearchaeota archaeon]
MKIRLIINGNQYERDVPPAMRLLDLLREELGFLGTKEGCGQGECGACSVLVDGTLVNSCLVPVGQINDSRIITIENQEIQLLQKLKRSFEEHGAVQCGFCIPGIIMAAYSLLIKTGKPTREEIREGISGNLCRCTGYTKIVDAVMAIV